MTSYPQLSILPELRQDFEAAKNIYKEVREASDDIRTRIIPQLIEGKVSAREAYWTLHRAEWGNHVTIATAWPVHSDDEGIIALNDEINHGRREYDLFMNHAWHVSVDDLFELESEFFNAIDDMRGQDVVDLLRKLTAIHALLMLAHFPEDIAGRTTEDFMVYIRRKNGLPFTISANGYRGEMGELSKHYPTLDNVTTIRNIQWTFYPNIAYDLDKSVVGNDVLTPADLRNFIGPLMKEACRRIVQKSWFLGSERAKAFKSRVISRITQIAQALVDVIRGSGEGAWHRANRLLSQLYKLHTQHLTMPHVPYVKFSKAKAECLDSTLALLSLEPIVKERWNEKAGQRRYWQREVRRALECLKQKAY